MNMQPENTLCLVCNRAKDSQKHVLRCDVLLDILPLEILIQYDHINETRDQQVEFIQFFERYLGLQDKLQENPSKDFSLPRQYSGLVPPQAGSTGLTGRSNDSHAVYVYHQAIKLILSWGNIWTKIHYFFLAYLMFLVSGKITSSWMYTNLCE